MERSQFLQLMRFVAAALVLCTHVTFYYNDRVDSSWAVWHFGEIGVPIFFVISGIVMVISTQALPLNGKGAQRFMLRRIIRIVPLWWVALGVKVLIALVHPSVVNHNHFQFDYAVKSFLFIPYFNEQGAVTPLHGVGWTLLHEIFFYLLFALSMLFGRRPVIYTSATIVALCVAGRFVLFDSPFWPVATSLANLEFVLGMIVGTALVSGNPRTVRTLAWTCAIAGLLLWLPHGLPIAKSYPVLLPIAAATLWLVRSQLPLRLSWFSRLGDSSYSLYLFHPFIAPALVLLTQRLVPMAPALAVMSITVVVTICLSHLIHRWIELPVVSIARRILVDQSAVGSQRVNNAS